MPANIVQDIKLLTAGDMSGNITSSSQQVYEMALCAIQAKWTGASAAGTLKLQISNDNVTFSDYTGSSTTVSGAGDFMWNLSYVAYSWIRVVFTVSSGTGSLNLTVTAKG